jgi:hypothetical protein
MGCRMYIAVKNPAAGLWCHGCSNASYGQVLYTCGVTARGHFPDPGCLICHKAMMGRRLPRRLQSLFRRTAKPGITQKVRAAHVAEAVTAPGRIARASPAGTLQQVLNLR